MRTTHTYAVLQISKEAYQEIRDKLEQNGYEHQFHGDLVDMHGLAIQPLPEVCIDCGAGKVCCKHCGTEWCLNHQPNPLVCPSCLSKQNYGDLQ